MSKANILVVDDNPDTRKRIESILREDYRLQTTNLASAADFLEGEENIDLVVANILQKDHARGPDKGAAFIEKAKAKKLRVVVVGNAEEWSHIEAMIRGVDGYVLLYGRRSTGSLRKTVYKALSADAKKQLEFTLPPPEEGLEKILFINRTPEVIDSVRRKYEGRYEILHADNERIARRIIRSRGIDAAIIDNVSFEDEETLASIKRSLKRYNNECQILIYGLQPKHEELIRDCTKGAIKYVGGYFRQIGLTARLTNLVKDYIEPQTEIRELKDRLELLRRSISPNYMLTQAREILEEIEKKIRQKDLSRGIDSDFIGNFSEQWLEARDIIEHVFEGKEGLVGKGGKVILRDNFEDGAETYTSPEKYVRCEDKEEFYLLKRYRSLKSAVMAHKDYHHFRQLRDKEGVDFRIARVWMPVITTKGEALTLGRLKIGPNLTMVFEVLNPEIEKGDERAKKLKRATLDLNLERLDTWQKHAYYKGEKQKDAKEVLAYYRDNLGSAFSRADKFTTLSLSPVEKELIRHALTIFDDELILNEDTVVRNLDNSPGNSGLELCVKRDSQECSRMQASKDDLYSTFFKEKGFKLDDLREPYYHWDTGDKPGHFLEDFWHMADSFEADLEKPERKRRFEQFMRIKYGDEELQKKLDEHLVDSHLVGFYRNFRKRDLVVIKYALKDEYLAKGGHPVISSTLEKRREQHQEKFLYYTKQSQYHLDKVLTELKRKYKDRLEYPVTIQLKEGEEVEAYPYLKRLDSRVRKEGLNESNARLFQEYFNKLRKLRITSELAKLGKSGSDFFDAVNALARIAKVRLLRHAVIKSYSHPEIDFKALLDPRNKDYLETPVESIR